MSVPLQRIAFIGTGQMATALAVGFTRSLLSATHVAGCDPSDEARRRFAEAVGAGVAVSADAAEILPQATLVVLAVKPQMITSVLDQIRAQIQPGHLVVSIAAGITLSHLAALLPNETRILRVMPNTPCLIGEGASAVSAGAHATASDTQLLCRLLETVGHVDVLPESLMDAVTGLSGSGPAYVFRIIQALSDGGVKMGLPRAAATQFAAQTVAGAARMVLQTRRHPADLADAVTSPGGTTIAGLHALESGALHATLMNAVEAASRRSAELGG